MKQLRSIYYAKINCLWTTTTIVSWLISSDIHKNTQPGVSHRPTYKRDPQICRYISYISDVELICSRLLTGLGLPLNWSKMSTSSQLCPFREISIQDCFLIWRIITRSDRKLKHAPKILMTGIRLTSDQWSVVSQQLIYLCVVCVLNYIL